MIFYQSDELKEEKGADGDTKKREDPRISPRVLS